MMKITALVENTSCWEPFESEHGLSLYIETEAHKILFDMGQTDMFARNAKRLGVELEKVDIAILSHGHYDHGGGLKTFLEINSMASVYISRYAFEPHYNGTEKYIGLDESLLLSDRLVFTDGVTDIADGLRLYSCNGNVKRFELGSFGLKVKENGSFYDDDFRHEQYLEIEENGKKVLISGCSHKGIMDIAYWFKPQALVGGFHFSKLPLDDKLAEYAKILDLTGTEYYTCHCTGVQQFDFMKKYMKKLRYLSCGQTVEL